MSVKAKPGTTVVSANSSRLRWGEAGDDDRAVHVTPSAPEDLSRAITDSRGEGAVTVLDLTSEEAICRTIGHELIDRVDAMVVSLSGWLGLQTDEIRRSPRVFIFAAGLFEPAVLAFRAACLGGAIGEVRGVEIDLTQQHRGRETLLGLAVWSRFLLRGIRGGRIAGASGQTEWYGWRDRGAIRIASHTPKIAGSGDQISGIAAGSSGSLLFDTDGRSLVLHSSGASPVRLPLPEGDGSYYCMREIIGCVETGLPARILPNRLIAEALSNIEPESDVIGSRGE